MLNENFVILGVLVTFLGGITYLLDVLKGKVQPNKITWFLWSTSGFIAFAAEVQQGVGIQSLITFSAGAIPFLIFLASFANKKSYWKIGKLDIAFGISSAIGLLLWYITKAGDIAILFSIIADGLAALPTIIKSYTHPETENWVGFFTGGIGAALTLLTIRQWSFAQFGFPLYILFANIILTVLIKFKIGKRGILKT